MLKKLFPFAVLVILAISFDASAQDRNDGGTARKIANGTAKTGVIVVGTAAKYTWKAAKFTAGKVAKPIIVKSAPKVGKFALKQSGRAAKKSLPVVKKFAITYLKLRFSP